MAEVVSLDSNELTSPDISTVRRVLDAAFEGRFDAHDWDHACGGRHVIVQESGEIVAHGSVVSRRLWIADDEHEVGYVEAVATEPAAQGRGYGTLVMRAIAGQIDARHRIGVLSTGEWDFYERLGWRRWRGPTYMRRSNGSVVRTPEEDDGIMVLAAPGVVDLDAAITCTERAGDDW